MNQSLAFFIGLRYTSARRRSQLVSFLSAISITGLAVGVALLVAVLSVMNGFDRELRERILGLVPQAAIYQRGGVEDWPDLVARISEDQQVLGVAPFVNLDALASLDNITVPVALYGVDVEAERAVSRLSEYVSADVYNSLASDAEALLLGRDIAIQMAAEVGDKVMLVVPDFSHQQAAPRIAYFRLAGIIHSGTELDNLLAVTGLVAAANLTGSPDRVTGVRLKLANLFDAPRVVYENLVKLGAGYYGNNWTRTHGNLYHAIHMSKSLVGLLMSLIVAIAAFNVVSTLVMVVVDKQGDIAILRTLGASTRSIMAIFMVQGTFIGLVGTAIGLVAGCILATGIADVVGWLERFLGVQFLKSDVYPLTYLPSEIQLGDILQVGLTALGLSFLATLYPAWRASRVQPAEALRYE
ncbi:lipoprotein-releasing ABC transporter permease subunit [Teredinibacter waterburyi]|jgi:lipoprotein releasing system, transmembrane protein, LolC/E family|uniref:lipoprotein-releasing ABC transporter permease subunit n=1 Tax=Teredinibacter waterburyi TaxID=1500538 RepID=UPI00165EE2DA|nr:lipoprotein-releasing ABC transporter permease subunit [Teredinibacter waterburyi]